MFHLVDLWHLVVPEYIPMAITTLFVGIVATTGFLPDWRFWLVSVSLLCVVGAFNSFNAIADKEIDRVNRPERPLPNSRISEKHALLFAIFLYFLALLISYLISIIVFWIVFAAVIITAAYSYPGIDLKKHFLTGTITVTIFYAILCFLAGWALYPTYPIPLGAMLFFFLLGFGLAVTKDFMDVPGDTFNSAHTLPVRLGYSQSVGIVFILLTFAFLFLTFQIYSGALQQKYYLLLLFYPLMFFNVNSFRKHAKSFYSNHVFLKTIALIILLEAAFAVLSLYF